MRANDIIKERGLNPKVIWPLGVLLVATLIAALLIKSASSVAPQTPEKRAQSVKVIEAAPEDIELNVLSQGSVEPRTQSQLIPEVSGTISWVSPQLVAGGQFSAGDALLKIEPADYETAVVRSKAALVRDTSRHRQSRRDLKRMQKLKAQNLASQSQFDEAENNFQIAEASLQEAKANLAQANRDLARTTIKAPYDGLVRSAAADIGQFVSRGNTVAEVYATDYLEVRLPIADSELAYFPAKGFNNSVEIEPTRVELSARYGGKTLRWDGEIVRMEAAIDTRSRMVYAVARIKGNDVDKKTGKADKADTTKKAETSSQEQNAKLASAAASTDEITIESKATEGAADSKPESAPPQLAQPTQQMPTVGLFVKARIKGHTLANAYTVPRAALRNGEASLHIVNDAGRIENRPVNIFRLQGSSAIIDAGLLPGELISISRLQTLAAGSQVSPVIVPRTDSVLTLETSALTR